MPICRSSQYYKYHVINSDEVIKYGMEKAAVLGNIEKCFHLKLEEYHTIFPYIEKKKFDDILSELLKEGLLIKEEI